MKSRLLITLLLIIASAVSILAEHRISLVQNEGSWVYIYDENGKKYKTLSKSSVGTVNGFSASFFVTTNGNWIYLYDAEGRKYKTLSKSSVGEILGVSGDTFTSRLGNWIYTWSRDGRKINSRYAG